ncbi:unnamed protein product, partial [Amoebophrya sp. A120]|eukprot:GSA120T00001285001.1
MGLADLISARAGESAEQEKTGLASIFGGSGRTSSKSTSGNDKNVQVPTKTGRSAMISGGSKPSASSSSKPINKKDHVIKDAEMEKKNAQKLQAALQAVRKFQRDGKREAREVDVVAANPNVKDGDVAKMLLGGNAVVDAKSKKGKKKQQQRADGSGAGTAEDGLQGAAGPTITAESEEERNKRTLFVGHIPLSWTDKQLKQFLTTQIRSAAVEQTIQKQDLHIKTCEDRDTEDPSKTHVYHCFQSSEHFGDPIVAVDGESLLVGGADPLKDYEPAATPASGEARHELDPRLKWDAEQQRKIDGVIEKYNLITRPAAASATPAFGSDKVEMKPGATSCSTTTTIPVIIDLLLRIECLRFRSLPVDAKFVNNRRAAHATKAYAEHGSSKNAYVVLRKEALPLMEKLAKKINGEFFDEEHRCVAEPLVKPEQQNVNEKRVGTDDSSKKSKTQKKGKKGDEDKPDKAAEDDSAQNNGSSSTTQKSSQLTGEFSRKKSVFVGNLPVSLSEHALEQKLTPFGTITKTRIVRDSTTQFSKGFAFVQFDDRASATKLIKSKEEIIISERKLRFSKVEEAEELEKKKQQKKIESEKVSLGKRVKQCMKKKALKTLTSQEQRQLLRSKKWLKSQKEKKGAGKSGGG